MKSLLNRLGVLGPSHYRSLLEEIREVQSRSAKLAQELELARDDAKRFKEKSDESAMALRHSKGEAEEHLRRADKLTRDLEKVKAEFERRYERDCRKLAEMEQKRGLVLEALEERIEKAESVLTAARDTLMAIEVKLDVLEGAANVLDVRTRTMSRIALADNSASM
jgi:chromosome segregation ATPase